MKGTVGLVRPAALRLTFPTDPKVDRIVANFLNNSLALFFDLQILVHVNAAQAPGVNPEICE